MLEDVILNKKKFAKMVEDIVHEKRIGYMDAVLHICQQREIDPLDVGNLITPQIKDKIQAEAVAANMMKGGNTLPI
jgi:hypothetical protein